MILDLPSDLQPKIEAARAGIEHEEEQGAERFAFLGDLVGYGAEPSAVIELVAERAGRGAIMIQGNHDAAIGEGGRGLNGIAYEARGWTRNALSSAEKEFLAKLPLVVRVDGLCCGHRAAGRGGRWGCVATEGG